MPPRSVIDLLSDQAPEDLLAMLQTAQNELKTAKAEADRKAAEVQLIEQALAKVQRRSGAGGRLTREQVLDVVRTFSDPVSAAEVRAALADDGIDASLNSVREHLRRLVEKNGTLLRLEDGRYMPVSVPTADDDIPF